MCFILSLVLMFNCLTAVAKNNMTLTQYGDDPNYIDVVVQSENVQLSSYGTITFESVDTDNVYIIDKDTDTYEGSSYLAYYDKFLNGEYSYIEFYALKSEFENGGTIHVAGVSSVFKNTIAYTPVTNAIIELNDMGIISGDPDGDLRLNDSLTRAEMAAIVCRLQAVKDIPEVFDQTFTDVPVDHWAAAYIDLAQKAKIINGNGDGTFRPEDKVTYDEAIKMLTSLIGYSPMADELGGYPIGYEIVAMQTKLTDGIAFSGTDVCPRRDIFFMSFGVLDIPLMSQTSYGENPSYVIMDGTNDVPYHTLRTDIFGE